MKGPILANMYLHSDSLCASLMSLFCLTGASPLTPRLFALTLRDCSPQQNLRLGQQLEEAQGEGQKREKKSKQNRSWKRTMDRGRGLYQNGGSIHTHGY